MQLLHRKYTNVNEADHLFYGCELQGDNMSIVGIDLGTTNSLVGIWKDGKCELIPNSFGEYLTPSVVNVDEEGNIYVGKVAKEKLISDPAHTVASFKRVMGTSKQYELGGKRFYPQELSSFVLRKLKEDAEAYLGEPIEEAIISVPAYFNDKQRYATKQAGQLAGLKVERLVNEPSAAALACSLEKNEAGSYLVFDFGGGTLDVSIVECFENIIEIIAVSGDNHLGGNDFDMALADYFCEEHHLDYDKLESDKKASLLREAEKCKQQLTIEGVATIKMEIAGQVYAVFIDNDKLVKIGSNILLKISKTVNRALADSKKTIMDIDEIIMVGGSCRMPVIKHYLKHLLGKKPITAGSPDETVAMGVGTYAGIKERKGEIKDLLLTDICPFTLGVNIINREDYSKDLMSPIIERNSTLPSSKIRTYCTTVDNQKELLFKVYQGESMYCHENLFLGEISIKVPPAPKGEEDADIRFSYDINGILMVEVYHQQTHVYEKKVLCSNEVQFTEEEIELRLKELEKLKIHPREKEENQMVIARGERLFKESLGEIRDMVIHMTQQFQQALATQEEWIIRKVREQANSFFDQIDNADIEEQASYFEEWLQHKDEGDFS